MHKPFRFAVIADSHYYAQSLGTSGEAYELRSGSDQKCLAETDALLRAVFAKLAQSDAEAVLIAGDLTNNGEIVSHEGFRALLYELKKKKPVYVITATHDWCSDGHNRRYEGDQVILDVPCLASEELGDFYRDFGLSQAHSTFTTHLGGKSACIAVNDDVWLLALNDDSNNKGRAGYTPEHLDWIQEQLAAAKEQNKQVIAVQHHLLMTHVTPLFSGGSTIGDRDEVAPFLADAGLRYLFTGHFHMHDIMQYTSPAGNSIYDINLASISGYPAPTVYATLSDDGLQIETDFLESFTYEGQTLGQDFLRAHLTGMFTRVLDAAAAGDKQTTIKRLNALNVPGEKIGKWFFLLKPLARYCKRADVKRVARLLRRLTFGKAVKKEQIANFPDLPVLTMVEMVLCNLFDGARTRYTPEDGFYQATMAVFSLPYKFKKNAFTKKLLAAGEHILTGGDIPNHNVFLPNN